MSVEFLRSLSQAHLPMRVEDEHCVECAHVLRAAGLVEAEIVYGDGVTTTSSAVVSCITHEGYAVLGRLRDNKPLA